jgi:hypothetical protein
MSTFLTSGEKELEIERAHIKVLRCLTRRVSRHVVQFSGNAIRAANLLPIFDFRIIAFVARSDGSGTIVRKMVSELRYSES